MTTKPHVIFYTRPGCLLCEEAKLAIDAADCAGAYTFEEVNIDADAELRRRYGWDIPVVVINDRMVFKHRLTADDFKRALSGKL